jgi:hypothetical protein
MRWSDRRDADVLCFLDQAEPADNDELAAVSATDKSVDFDVSPEVALKLYTLPEKVEKWIVLMSERAGTSATMGYVLPDGWSIEAVDRAVLLFKDAKGGVVYKSKPAAAWDSSADKEGPKPVPCFFDLVKSEKPPTILGRPYWQVAVSCEPSREAVWPILMDPTVTISGAAGIEDTLLYQANPANNFGGSTQISLYEGGGISRHCLHRIVDAATAIPAGTVDACRMFITRRNDGTSAKLYRVADANVGWVEGSANGSAEVGASSWNRRLYDTANWAGSQGCSTAGTDYVNTVLGSFAAGPGGTAYAKIQIDLDTSAPTHWRDTSNTGVLSIADGAAYVLIDTVEHATSTRRPYFEIDYTEPPPPPSGLCLIAFDPGGSSVHYRPMTRPSRNPRLG